MTRDAQGMPPPETPLAGRKARLAGSGGKCRQQLAAGILVALLAGCSTLASKEATIGCQVADTATTLVALNKGAVEANPILSGLSPGAFVAVKIALLYLLLTYREEIGEPALATVNVATCGVAIHNIGVIRGLP